MGLITWLENVMVRDSRSQVVYQLCSRCLPSLLYNSNCSTVVDHSTIDPDPKIKDLELETRRTLWSKEEKYLMYLYIFP